MRGPCCLSQRCNRLRRRSGGGTTLARTILRVEAGGAGPQAAVGVAGPRNVLAVELGSVAVLSGAGNGRGSHGHIAVGGAGSNADEARIGCGGRRSLAFVGRLFEADLAGGNLSQGGSRLRTNDVVLIGRDRNRSQNGDDRNNDHQFDKGEALLVLHLVHPQDGGG